MFAGDGFGGNRVFAARRVGVCWRWLWPLSGFRSCSAAPPSSAQRVCRVEPMFRAGAGASSSGLHTRQTGRPTPRARGGGWGASGLSEGIGGGRGGGSEGPGGALGRAPSDYTHDSRAGRRNARGAGRAACGPGRPTRRGGGRNGWRGGRRQEHRPNGPHGARPYVPDRAPLSPRSARAPQPPTYARGGGRNGWRGGRPEQHSPSARPEHRFHAANTLGG